MVVPGVLPACCIRAVHFRNKDDRREFQVREYSNLRPRAYELEITPAWFSGESIFAEHFQEGARQACSQLKPLSPDGPGSIDAASGALLLAGGLARRDSAMPLRALLRPLAAFAQTEQPSTADDLLPDQSALRLLRLISPVIADSPTPLFAGEDATAVRGTLDSLIPEGNIPDMLTALIFSVSLKLMSAMSPEEFVPERVLDAILSRFRSMVEDVVPEADSDTTTSFAAPLEAVRSVLGNEMDIADFPASGNPVAHGLLLFFQRSEPWRMIGWLSEQPAPASESLALAAALSGTLYGRARIPVEQRPRQASFEHHLDLIAANRINATVNGPQRRLHEQDYRIEEQSVATNGPSDELLMIGSQTLMRREARRAREQSVFPSSGGGERNPCPRNPSPTSGVGSETRKPGTGGCALPVPEARLGRLRSHTHPDRRSDVQSQGQHGKPSETGPLGRGFRDPAAGGTSSGLPPEAHTRYLGPASIRGQGRGGEHARRARHARAE